MSACEWCWKAATWRASYSGGSVAEHYADIVAEQQKRGRDAPCPVVREQAYQSRNK